MPELDENGKVEIEAIDSGSDLTTWDNPPKVSDLKQDLEDAKSTHGAQVLKIDRWLENLNITGAAKIKKVAGKSALVPKLIRKQAEWRYASLSEPFLSTDDIFNTDPVTYEDKESAVQNGLVLNNQFNTKIQKVKFVDDYVRTAVDEGTVIVRVGWEEETEEVEVEVPILEEQLVTDPIIAAQMDAQGIPPIKQVQVGTQLETQTRIIKNQPTLDICDYRNVVIDPTAKGDLEKASFIVYSFESSRSELEKDGKYKNLDKIVTTTSSVLNNPDHATQEPEPFEFKDKPRKKLVVHEYWGEWDIDGSGIVKPFVAAWVGNVMIRMEENPFPDKKHPFVSAQYLPIRKSVYGEPDGELLEENQQVIGAVTRGMIDVMGRSANGQMAHLKGALDVTNRRKFEKGLDYEYNGNVDPSRAFYMHTYPEIPQSAQYMLNMQHAEAESLTGVKAFSQGISGEALGSTATGVRSALDATSKRELGILRRLAEGMKQIGRKIIAMNAVFLSDEEVIRITNEEFVTVRRDDLAGNIDLKLTISTAEADNDKAQELAFMLQTTGQTMGPAFSQVILADIAKLRKMPDLAKKIAEFEPTPDPLEQKRVELELALLEAQVMNEQAKGQENQVDVGLKTAKTATEEAKARNLQSGADKADLDFLEQQSSTTHDREIDKLDTKRKSDIDVVAANALMNKE